MIVLMFSHQKCHFLQNDVIKDMADVNIEDKRINL